MTPEELAAMEAAADAEVTKLRTARDAIIVKEGASARGVKGSIPCPVCQLGILSYAIHHGRRAAIWATCSSSGCVRWIE